MALHQPETSKANRCSHQGFVSVMVAGSSRADPLGSRGYKTFGTQKKLKSAHQGAPVEEVLSGVAMLGAPSAMSEPLHRSTTHHLAVHRSAKAAPLSAVRSEILSQKCQLLHFGSFACSEPLAHLLLSREKLNPTAQTKDTRGAHTFSAKQTR